MMAGGPTPMAGDSAGGPLGIYVHVPFCSAICTYCNFNRGLFDEALARRYVRALVLEIGRAADGAPADTVYFGGGTPSLLEAGEVAGLLRACRDAFTLAPGAEVTLEANPETVDAARLAGFREAGVTRLSLGVQSFRDEELRRLGRLHDAARARAALAEARAAGFENVSLDLMLWLPGQGRGEWLESVDGAIDARPDHVSLYLLELYANAPLKENMARGHWSLVPDDDAADMYLDGLARFDRAGYAQYEISNTALPGRACRHNLKYWADGQWLAFGCGAHGTRDGRRWRNVPGTADYVERVEDGESPVADERALSPEDRLVEALITGLRLAEGVSIPHVRSRHGADVWTRFGERLVPARDAGLLVVERDRLRLTREGMLVANEILRVFV